VKGPCLAIKQDPEHPEAKALREEVENAKGK
jgi:hypothetical protein